MILASARLALLDVASPPFRSALWKVLGLTALVLVGLWFAVSALFESVMVPYFAAFMPDMPAWVDGAGPFAAVLAGILLAVLLAFLIAPISALIAGLFLDDVAEVVERERYPGQPAGVALPFLKGLVLSVKFLGIVVLGNLLAFALLLVPGVNVVAFFVVNGYLLGREYFEFAAYRYRPEAEAHMLRRRYRGTVFFAGLVVAAFLAVPILNLLTPLFAASFMVHLHQRVSAREGGLTRLSPPPGRGARLGAPAR
jgi:CysZ protein